MVARGGHARCPGTGRDKPVPYEVVGVPAEPQHGVGATLVVARGDMSELSASPLSRGIGVGATLVVARGGHADAWTTGRDKPVPYGRQ